MWRGLLRKVLEIEINIATDNPLCFPSDSDLRRHGGLREYGADLGARRGKHHCQRHAGGCHRAALRGIGSWPA